MQSDPMTSGTDLNPGSPAWWRSPRVISVVVDNDSWILPYAESLVLACEASGDEAVVCRDHEGVRNGAVAFYLGCVKITPRSVLDRNRRNLVVHESNLPKGRGFAPMTWQILGGAREIPFALIEAADVVDGGAVAGRGSVVLSGTELAPEWRDLQGRKTVELCLEFLAQPLPPAGVPQAGEPTDYARRRPVDSQLDPERSIAEQFELLRVCDNERYPAFFDYRGRRFALKIEPHGESPELQPPETMGGS